MSIQSDIEMLSVLVVEEYATKNDMMINEAYELFYRHHIFEKMILQHEYLHQVAMDEVMEFVYKELQDTCQNLTLFHGTDADFIEIQLNMSHNKRDLGIGI